MQPRFIQGTFATREGFNTPPPVILVDQTLMAGGLEIRHSAAWSDARGRRSEAQVDSRLQVCGFEPSASDDVRGRHCVAVPTMKAR